MWKHLSIQIKYNLYQCLINNGLFGVVVGPLHNMLFHYFRGRCGNEWMVVYNYLCKQCLLPLMLWVWISIWARCTTLFDKVCQWLGTGRWFPVGPPVSSTIKTDRHDITEILLKLAWNTINQTNKQYSIIYTSSAGLTVYSSYLGLFILDSLLFSLLTNGSSRFNCCGYTFVNWYGVSNSCRSLWCGCTTKGKK